MKNNVFKTLNEREVFQNKLPFLLQRNKIITAIKNNFNTQNFYEVDTPILQYSPGMEVHIKAFKTKFVNILGNEDITLYLHTSPEFAMKKLLSYGLNKIYQFTHTFRNEIISPTHYPEFTMLEWYRLDENYNILMTDCEDILKTSLNAIGKDYFQYKDKKCYIKDGIEKLTIKEAFEKFCKLDILQTIDDINNPSPTLLKQKANHLNINISENDTWDDIYEKLMFEYIEPNLGISKPTILYEYPIHQAALSKAKTNTPNIAERFELYVCGIELANAFTELTDKEIQLKRFTEDKKKKENLYGESYPIDEEFIEAIGNIKSATGIAMGIDRLIMLSTGAQNITDIMWSEIPKI